MFEAGVRDGREEKVPGGDNDTTRRFESADKIFECMGDSSALNPAPAAAAEAADPAAEGELLEFASAAADHSSVLLIIPGSGISLEQARLLAAELEHNFRTILYNGPLPGVVNVYQFSAELHEKLLRKNVKRSTILAAGSACNVAQAIAVSFPGSVRRLALVDPLSRMFPTFGTKVIDWIESHLPLGLPLRPTSDAFDSRSFLHRLRCPVLIVSTPQAGIMLRAEAAAMHRRIPNALLSQLRPDSSSYQHELGRMVKDLLQRPVKRPQKNL